MLCPFGLLGKSPFFPLIADLRYEIVFSTGRSHIKPRSCCNRHSCEIFVRTAGDICQHERVTHNPECCSAAPYYDWIVCSTWFHSQSFGVVDFGADLSFICTIARRSVLVVFQEHLKVNRLQVVQSQCFCSGVENERKLLTLVITNPVLSPYMIY